MSEDTRTFESDRKLLASAGENLQRAQEEIGNLIPLESDRSRVVVLLNNVGDALGSLGDKIAEEDEKDTSTESDVRPGFDRTEANKTAVNRNARNTDKR